MIMACEKMAEWLSLRIHHIALSARAFLLLSRWLTPVQCTPFCFPSSLISFLPLPPFLTSSPCPPPGRAHDAIQHWTALDVKQIQYDSIGCARASAALLCQRFDAASLRHIRLHLRLLSSHTHIYLMLPFIAAPFFILLPAVLSLPPPSLSLSLYAATSSSITWCDRARTTRGTSCWRVPPPSSAQVRLQVKPGEWGEARSKGTRGILSCS